MNFSEPTFIMKVVGKRKWVAFRYAAVRAKTYVVATFKTMRSAKKVYPEARVVTEGRKDKNEKI